MKKAKFWCGACLAALLGSIALTSCGGGGGNDGKDTYDKKGRLILNLKNVYFDRWTGDDNYTEIINNQFGVKIKASNYSYKNWDTQVGTAINGNNLTDVIQFNLKNYNFGSSYETWVGFGMLKPLPDDMSAWPNIQNLLANTSSLQYLKIEDKLYGIPIANDIANPQKDFSNMTYVYRRDWAKKLGLYKEDDVYTWQEFKDLLTAFKDHITEKDYAGTKQSDVLVDEAWGFPSVTNFYKNAPHCYDLDETGKCINAFTSEGYLDGLDFAKGLVSSKIYSPDQGNWDEEGGDATNEYSHGRAAVLYDNFSFSNYLALRTSLKTNCKLTGEALDDASAFMKVKGPNGHFALENTENWFSMTMFNYKISDEKMAKILDIIDYLLTEDGTRLGIYGEKDFDYSVDPVTQEITLNPNTWEKSIDTGEYSPRENGAKYLRYMATLGHDTKSYDPYTDQRAYDIFTKWNNDMNTAKADNLLDIVVEPANISWMSTPKKNSRTKANLSAAKRKVADYCYGEISKDKYKSDVENLNGYKEAINEINANLGK